MPRIIFLLAFITLLMHRPAVASAQMVMMQSPLQNNSASFYEHSHIGWSVNNPHYFMRVNGGGGIPPFGGYQPNAGLHGGFAVGNSQFDFAFGQGASYTGTSVTPVLTTTNGYPGSLFVGSTRPFVTGLTPVVGGGFANVPPAIVPPLGPLASRVATGQLRMDRGRLEIPVLDAAGVPPTPLQEAGVRGLARGIAAPAAPPASPTHSPRRLTAVEYMERAVAAEKDGRPGVAKIYYQLAATKGDAVIKAEVKRKLDALKSP
jgi:hypothetical protein